MNDEERRLADVLDRLVPEPRRQFSASDIVGRRGIGHRGWWPAPLIAAAAVAAIAVTTSVLAVQQPWRSGHPPASSGAFVLGGTAASQSTWQFSPPGALSGRPRTVCETGQLRITPVAVAAGWANFVGEYLGFTNTGKAPCSLSGWPTVIGRTASGQEIAAQHIGALGQAGPFFSKPPLIVLRPGERAVAVLYEDDNSASGTVACTSTYRQLRLTPPGNTQGTTMSAQLLGRSGYAWACWPLQVSPIVPSTDVPPGVLPEQ